MSVKSCELLVEGDGDGLSSGVVCASRDNFRWSEILRSSSGVVMNGLLESSELIGRYGVIGKRSCGCIGVVVNDNRLPCSNGLVGEEGDVDGGRSIVSDVLCDGVNSG